MPPAARRLSQFVPEEVEKVTAAVLCKEGPVFGQLSGNLAQIEVPVLSDASEGQLAKRFDYSGAPDAGFFGQFAQRGVLGAFAFFPCPFDQLQAGAGGGEMPGFPALLCAAELRELPSARTSPSQAPLFYPSRPSGFEGRLTRGDAAACAAAYTAGRGVPVASARA